MAGLWVDYFHLSICPKVLVFFQDWSMVYTTLLKITPWLNRRRGREGITRRFASGWGWVRRGNLDPETLGRVVFEKGFVDARTREILSSMAPFQRIAQYVLCFCVFQYVNWLPVSKGSPLRSKSVIFRPDCQPMGQRSGNDDKEQKPRKVINVKTHKGHRQRKVYWI